MVLVCSRSAGSQLLFRQLPNYQDEIRAWVTAELGFELDYARLDAAWGWRGPELAFRDVRARTAGDTTPFLTARSALVGFSAIDALWRLARGREVGVERLTFDGTELTLVRTEDGAYRLQGAPAQTAAQSPASVQVPPDIDVLVRNSRVLYLDAARGIAWDFQDVAGSLRRDEDVLTLEASARPPSEFADHIEVTAQAFVADEDAGAKFTGDWRLSADLDEVDLAVAARLFPPFAVAPQAGRGDVAIWLEWQHGVLASGTAELGLADVVLQSSLGAVDSGFDRIALSGDWQRTADTWRFALRDVAVTRSGRAWPEAATVDIEVVRDAADISRVCTAQQLPAARGPDAVLCAVARVAPARIVVCAGAARRSARRRRRAHAYRRRGYRLYGCGRLREPRHRNVRRAARHQRGLRASSAPTRAPGGSSSRARARRSTGPTLFRGVLDVPELEVSSSGAPAKTPCASSATTCSSRHPPRRCAPISSSRCRWTAARRSSTCGWASRDSTSPRCRNTSRSARCGRPLVAWLDSALRGGRATSADVTFVGPVRAFPFDGGEGEFRATVDVEDGALAFVRDWPMAEDLDGTIEFVNARFAARGSGRILGNRSADIQVGIGDLRSGDFTLQADTIGGLDQVLAFLNRAPLIARYLGEEFARLEAPSGTGAVSLDLALPLRNREAYRLTAGLDIIDGELSYRDFAARITEIEGSLTLADRTLRGEGIEAIFLDGPVTASVGAAGVPGYRTRIDVEGEVTIDAVVDAFSLPYGEQLAGQTGWQGTLLLPTVAGPQSLPTKITVASNLSGVALRFPEPFAKPPGEPTNLELNMTFPQGALAMDGYLGATRRFALDFDATFGEPRPFKFRRAALEFGGALAEFRAERGVTLNGSLPRLSVDEWLALSRSGTDAGNAGTNGGNWSGVFAGADLNVAEFSVFGQRLGSTRVSARRRTDDWQLELDSDAIAGTLLVPIDLSRRAASRRRHAALVLECRRRLRRGRHARSRSARATGVAAARR